VNLEKGDLDARMSFALIVSGRLEDILVLKSALKRLLENELHELKLVYLTISARKLWVVKR